MAAGCESLGLVLLLGAALLACAGAKGGALLTEVRLCPQGDNRDQYINLSCPDDHLVIIVQASYRRSRDTGCHPSSPDACAASDVSSQLTMPCFFRLGTCQIKLVAGAIPGCVVGGVTYLGEAYFHVLYKCEPLMLSSNPLSQTVDMCLDAVVSGSLVYLWNTGFPQYTTSRTCRCVVSVDHKTEMEIKLPHFKAHRQDLDTTACPQVMHFWSGSRVRSVCSEADDSFTPLEMNVNSSLYIEFDNPQAKMTQFWITLGVHHSQTMAVRCGPGLVFPPRPFPPPTTRLTPPTIHKPPPTTPPMLHNVPLTTLGPWRRRPPGGSGRGALVSRPTLGVPPGKETVTEQQALHTAPYIHSIGYIPIIAAAVGATLIIAIIIMVVVIGCRKRRKRTQSPPAAVSGDPDFAFDNEIYMTEAARRRPAPAGPHPAPVGMVSLPAAPDGPLPAKQTPRSGGKRLLALEAPKGSVVPNPYAGIPADSPDHKAWEELGGEKGDIEGQEKYWDKAEGVEVEGFSKEGASPSKGSLTSADYEDLAHFQQTFKAMLKLKNSTSQTHETKLQLP